MRCVFAAPCVFPFMIVDAGVGLRGRQLRLGKDASTAPELRCACSGLLSMTT